MSTAFYDSKRSKKELNQQYKNAYRHKQKSHVSKCIPIYFSAIFLHQKPRFYPKIHQIQNMASNDTAAMQPIHLAIGLVEGCITAAVLCFIYETRGEILDGVGNLAPHAPQTRLTFAKLFGVLSVATLAIAALLSLVASEFPDGLEWSLEKVAGTSELESQGGIYETALKVQESTALLPDYAFIDSQSLLGTSVSGVVGALVVLILCVFACYLFRIFKGKTSV